MDTERESSSLKRTGKPLSSSGKIHITRARAGEIRSSLKINKADMAIAKRAIREVTSAIPPDRKVTAPKSHSASKLVKGGGVGRKKTK